MFFCKKFNNVFNDFFQISCKTHSLKNIASFKTKPMFFQKVVKTEISTLYMKIGPWSKVTFAKTLEFYTGAGLKPAVFLELYTIDLIIICCTK